MMKVPADILYVALGFVVFLGIWITLFRIIAMASGWARLAQAYRCDEPIEGVCFLWQDVTLRWGWNYSNCMIFSANETGVGVCPMVPFRHGHRPLFFPWSDIRIERKKIFRLIPRVVFHFQEVADVSLTISARLASRLQPCAGPSWPESSEPASPNQSQPPNHDAF